jgi:hypothetical protein
MADDSDDAQVYVVYSDGPHGETYPYGVFTTREAAAEAREAIIKELDTTTHETLDSEEHELAHQLAGSLDETTSIQACQLRSEFTEDVLDDLFEEYD